MARRGWWALVLMLLLSQSGCLWTDEVVNTSWLKRFQNQTISPDHALIEVALLECPPGDEYINHALWQHADEYINHRPGQKTDELIVDLERRSALEENGFRLGQLVGETPSGFQKLLLSKRCCSNPQAMIFPAGKTVPIFLGPELAQSTYTVVENKRATEVALDQARFALEVNARFTSNGRTTLNFTPRVEHGEQLFPFQAAPDLSRWELRMEKAAKKYAELSWEVTLDVNQYLIIGARPERERSLGQTAFMQQDGAAAVQRLLVIRNCRSVTARDAHDNSVEELVRKDKSPPLAIQATMPATRAKTN